MTITLTTVGSRGITGDIARSALEEAAVTMRLGLRSATVDPADHR